MDDRDWTILHYLYIHKNITKTAELLFITQPSITKRLRQMEKEFGIQIVQRGRRGVHFTLQGEYLAKSAEEMLDKMKKFKENIQKMDHRVHGKLRIGASNFFNKYKLPDILKMFNEQHPQVDFHVTTGWSREIYNLINNKQVDIAFIRGDYDWYERKYLLFEEALCIASMDPINLKDLPKLPRIDYQTDQLFMNIVDNWWMGNYSEPPLIGMKVDQIDTCREMLVNGLGYAILPRFIVADIKDVYKMNILDKGGNPFLRQTWMFYHQDSMDINVVRAFAHFMEELEFEDEL